MRKLILPFLALAPAPASLSASDPTRTAPEIGGPGDLDRDEQFGEIDAILNEDGVPGAHITLTMGPDVVLARAFGRDPAGAQAAFGSDTPARLASASKLLTALTVLSMVEEGTLSLDETLSALDPSLPGHWHAIPVWRVLNHTSGIPMVVSREDFTALDTQQQLALTPADLLDMIGAVPLDFAPGEGYGLAMVVQRFGDLAFFGHSAGGGLADIRYAPGMQLGIAVLTNRAGGTGSATEIADLLAERFAGQAHRSEASDRTCRRWAFANATRA